MKIKAKKKVTKIFDLKNIDSNLDDYCVSDVKKAIEAGLLNVNDKKYYFLHDTNNIEMLELLINKGINLNRKKDSGNTALFKTNTLKTRLLIKHGININLINKEQQNALWGSAIYPFKYLVKAGINVNQRDRNGQTALWDAFDIQIDYLLNAGIDINAKDKNGRNVLFALDAFDIDKLETFINAGIDINVVDKEGNNALFNAKIDSNSKWFKNECILFSYKYLDEEYQNDTIAHKLIEEGINIHQINKDGENALFWQNYNGIEELLEKGVSPNILNKNDLYPLFFHLKSACSKDENFKIGIDDRENVFSIIKLYEKFGFDLFTTNKAGDNILDILINANEKPGCNGLWKIVLPEETIPYLVEKGLFDSEKVRKISPDNELFNTAKALYEKIIIEQSFVKENTNIKKIRL